VTTSGLAKRASLIDFRYIQWEITNANRRAAMPRPQR